VLRDSGGDSMAAILASGDLYLAGGIDEHQDLSTPPNDHAMIVRNGEGAIMSFIDENGNLKMRGELIVKGIPYSLRSYTSDAYSPF
jgi:hypothetical protein